MAKHQGRISLSPVTHIDPFGTLLFPAIVFFATGGMFGWARPTPVNPLAWRNKRVANFWVSIAGILGNFAIATVAGLIIAALFHAGLLGDGGRLNWIGAAKPGDTTMAAVAALLEKFFTVNVVLGVFNLFPIPPLDGSKILASILPESFESGLDLLNHYGWVLLIVALFTGVFGKIFSVVIPFAWSIVYLGAS